MSTLEVAAAPSRLGLPGRIVLVSLLVAGTLLVRTNPFATINFVSYGVVGTFLIFRRPRNAIGWLLLAIAGATIGTSNPTDIDLAGLTSGTGPLGEFVPTWAGTWSTGVSWILYAALALTFPTGTLPGGRSRRVTVLGLVVGLIFAVAPALTATFPYTDSRGNVTDLMIPNRFPHLPIPAPTDVTMVVVVVTVVPLLVFAMSVVGTIFRFRRSSGIVRLQLRWFFASVAFVVIGLLYGLTSYLVIGPSGGFVSWLPALIAYPTVPIAVAFAVTRYRLFDIDRIISRTISYGLVSAILVCVYVGIVLLMQGLLGQLVGSSTAVVAGSTLVVASLFQPIRRRTQTAVDRRFNRQRYDADRTVVMFAERVRDHVELEPVMAGLDATVRSAVAPTLAGIWLRDRAP